MQEIVKCNDFTAKFGLTLSHADAVELVQTRTLALRNNGRIEFKGGVINRIIQAFSDSPYISMDNYVETLHELIELFYSYKNETLDLISDIDLIEFMKTKFNGQCQGSLELLSGHLANLALNLRHRRISNPLDDSTHDGEDVNDAP